MEIGGQQGCVAAENPEINEGFGVVEFAVDEGPHGQGRGEKQMPRSSGSPNSRPANIAANSVMPTRSMRLADWGGGALQTLHPEYHTCEREGDVDGETSRHPPSPTSAPPKVWTDHHRGSGGHGQRGQDAAGGFAPGAMPLWTRCIAAGNCADVPNPSSTRATTSTPSVGASVR